MDRRSFSALLSDSTSASHTTRRHRGRPTWGSYFHQNFKATPCWHHSGERYLNALPNGEHFGKDYQVVATDGSLGLNPSSTQKPTMGAGVMWHNATIPQRSEWVGGQHASKRAELAAVVTATQGNPRTDDLVILIGSAAAIQRLRWFRSHGFRPAEHKVQDYDIIYDILRELKLQSESS